MLDSVRLALVGEGRHATNAEAVDDEDFARVGFFFGAVDTGGDEEAVELGAAKGTGCSLDAREVDLAELFTGGRIKAGDAAAVAERHPEVAVGVDRHTVGRSVVAALGGVDGDAGVADAAAGIVVIVGTDLLRHRVDVIQFGGVGIPADAIGVSDLIDFEVQGGIGIEHVEVGIANVFDEADGACPEAAGRVALAVVEAVGGTFLGFWIGELLLCAGFGIEGDDAGVAGIEVAAVAAWHDGADSFADIPSVLVAGFRIERDECVAFDIDVDESIIPPDRAFAPFGNSCADGLDGEC